MKNLLILLVTLLTLASCMNKKIEITPNYIINANWDEQANAIKINKLKLKKDSVINPYSDLNQIELLEKLENDTSFLFVGNVTYNGEQYLTRKVYFDKPNGFFWWSNNGETKTETIGELQKDNWYKFSHLVTYPYYVYVYIGSVNKVHRFDVNLANY
jgi:hypothetical protein